MDRPFQIQIPLFFSPLLSSSLFSFNGASTASRWEQSDFPIICESCLDGNPYVRMTRADYDKDCKICTRPFTVFRWRPGREARYKKTELCLSCSKLKNVCQVCLLDLEYGLPVQVRDTALSINSNDSIPKSDVNREYFAEEHNRRARAGIDYESSYGKQRPNDTILKLQRTTPYYKRNRAHVCSFFVRGECTRGAECPYRHEMPETGELSQQNIKDRYYGVNDPVALKLLSKAGEMPTLAPPDDESVKTLYIGGLNARISEQYLWDFFYAHGEIESIRMVLQRACAFVTYTTREAAEKAAEELSNKLVIKGLRLKLMWGKPQAPKPEGETSVDDDAARQVAHSVLLPRVVIQQQGGAVGGAPQQTLLPPQLSGAQYYFNIPPPLQPERAFYPSMDPQRMGALVPNSQEPCDSKEKQPQAPPEGHGHGPSYLMAPSAYFQGQYPPYYPQYGGYMAQPPPAFPQQYSGYQQMAPPSQPTAAGTQQQQQRATASDTTSKN